MAGTAVSYNRIFIKIQNTLPVCIESNNLNLLKEVFDFRISEGVKCFVEAAVRDYVLRKVCIGKKTNLHHVEAVVNMCIEGVRQDLCLPTLPVLVLSDAFDCLTIQQCEELFEFVESNVAIWKEELFFSPCKNQVLRMCNDVLRRLSRSQNTIFCGRILLFLARFFPFSERSGLNLISEFNLENSTMFTDLDTIEMETDGEIAGARTGMDIEDGTEHIDEENVQEKRPSLDYTLYSKFWALQDFFRNPVQCYQKAPWKVFTKYADDILEAFCSFKLDAVHTQSSSNAIDDQPLDITEEEQYFPKYLTNQKLLDLQFSDSNFRRYILVQMLILAQYLTSNIKFKQETLNEEQLGWVSKLQEKAMSLLTESPPNGKGFVDIIKHIQKREEMWSDWKNNGCPEIKKPGSSLKRKAPTTNGGDKNENAECDANENAAKKIKKRISLGQMIREADSKNKYIMGNAEMTRLWNIFPNNLEACQQSSRDFVPSLESYFLTAIEQSVSKTPIKDEEKLVSKMNFGWRGLRLLASKSPHFFTHSTNPIATLPEYLSSMVKKLAKDMPSQQQVEEAEEEKEEEKGIAMLDQNEAGKEEEEEEIEEEEPARDELKPIEEEERKKIAQAFIQADKDSWKSLGKKLEFEPDELDYFESEGKTIQGTVEVMLERWVENEKEEANKASLLYILEGLKMVDIIKNIL